jgi:hypothetical protein
MSARKAIASRHPERSPPALIGAAAAVGFFVSATLYDILAFPHGTYIFLYIAGLVAVVVAPARRPASAGAEAEPHARERRPRPRTVSGHAGAHPRRAPAETQVPHAAGRPARGGS